MIDGRHITYYEDDESTNLSADQQTLLRKHREIVEARKKEQEAQKAEAERLDEILRICEEYAKQQTVADGGDQVVDGGGGGGGGAAAASPPSTALNETWTGVGLEKTDDHSVSSPLPNRQLQQQQQPPSQQQQPPLLLQQQPQSPQSPPPLNKPGRKAYGLGLLSNASVEASKEILRTG